MKQSPFRFIYALYSLVLNQQDIFSFCELILPIKGIGAKFIEKLKLTYSSNIFSGRQNIVDFFTPQNISEESKQWQIVFRVIKDFIAPATTRYQKGISFSLFNQSIFNAMDSLFNYEGTQYPDKNKLGLDAERGQYLKVFTTLSNVYKIASEEADFQKMHYQDQFRELYESLQLSQDVYAKEKTGDEVSVEKDAVGLHTIHSYKGKENDYIYYACVNPLYSMDYYDFESRCLFYVAITRSKRKLTISCADSMLNYENRMMPTFQNPFLEKFIQIVREYKNGA